MRKDKGIKDKKKKRKILRKKKGTREKGQYINILH